MPINVSAALDADTGEPIQIERSTGGGYVDGLYVKPVAALLPGFASVQAPSAEEIQTLPEGERTKDIRKFICTVPLYAADEENTEIADIVLYQNKRFKIIRNENWNVYGHSTAYGAAEL